MPTYEYRCHSCGEHLEVVQSITDDPLTECPACHGPLRKVFHPVGIAFKGSGFYKTDSRSGARSPGSSDGASSESKAETKSESSTSSGAGSNGDGAPSSSPAGTSSS